MLTQNLCNQARKRASGVGLILFIFLLTACGTQPAPPAAPTSPPTSPPTETPTPQPTLTPTPTVIPGPFEGQPAIPYPSDEVVQGLGITAYQVVGEQYVALSEEGYVVAQAITNERGEFTGWQRTVPFDAASGLVVPHPQETNPELVDLEKSDAPIPQFVNAMRMGGIEVDPQRVVENLRYQPFTGVDGKPYVIGAYHLDPSPATQGETLEGPIPLVVGEMNENGEWRWSKVTLKDLAEKNDILIGSFFGGLNLGPGDFERIANIMKQEFSLGGIWIGMSDIQPSESNFDLTNLDLSKRGLVPLYHPLIWFDSSPDWIKNKTAGELMPAIVSHVQTVSKKIESNYQQGSRKHQPILIVVNEARHPRDFYFQKLGFDYIITAFQTARERSPSSILIYNDYDNHLIYGSRYNNTKQIVDQLRSAGLIDGVGIQLVLQGDNPPSLEDVVEAFKSYGLPVYITEFSVNMRNVGGSPQQRLTKQAEIYKTAINACLESGVCKAFVSFQIGDRFSVWENNQFLPYYSVNADPTPFDDNLNPKMAFFAQLQALLSYLSR